MNVPALSAADHELLALLNDFEVLDARQLQQLLSVREQTWNRQTQRLQGTYCAVVNGQLRLTDYATGEEKAAFSLESGFPSMGDPVMVWIDPASGAEIGRAKAPAGMVGLLVTADGCFAMTPNLVETPYLGKGNFLPVIPGHDLIVSPDGQYLLVSERQGGRLQVFSLTDYSRLASLDVRDLGSHQSMHACFGDGVIWLTDPTSTRIGRIEIPAEGEPWELNWQELDSGNLGQMVLSPDGGTLFVLGLLPKLRVLSLDPQSLTIRQEMALGGMAISVMAPKVPTDCLNLLTSERLQILYLTREGKQSRQTTQQLSLRLSLAGELQNLTPTPGWPWLLPGEVNPLKKWGEQDLAHWVVELGFLSAEYLVHLRQEARNGKLLKPGEEAATAFMVPCGDEAPIDVLLRPAPDLDFSSGAEDIVFDLLLQASRQAGLRTLSPEIDQILRIEAESVCDFLREHYVALVEVALDEAKGLFLDLVIDRSHLLRLLDQRLGGKSLPWRPGHRCPMCQMLLPNPRLCRHCDFALENPDWQTRKALQSAEACDELIPGQLVLALPQARRVSFLDAWLQVIAEHDTYSETKWKEPVHMLALPGGNWLVCDKGSAQAIEIDPSGHLVSLFDHRFKQPVMATFRRQDEAFQDILVLDQGAGQILAFDREGKLTQQWGPDQGLKLNAPRDLQWTWSETFLVTETGRVSEFNPAENQTVRGWGAAQGLQKPVLARRLPDGQTLIADAGRGEILFFGESELLIKAVPYWPPPDQDPAWVGQGAPERWIVLPNGDLLGLGKRYWLLLHLVMSPLGEHDVKLRWVQPWTGTRRPPNLKQRLLEMAEEDESIKPLRQLRLLQNLASLSLQRVSEQIEPLRCEAGEWLLKPNDPSGTLFFLLEGEVGIRREAGEPALAILKAGETFGEVPLVLGENYPAGFQTIGPAMLYQLKRSRFKQLVMQTGEIMAPLRELAFTRKALLAQHQSSQLQERVDRVKAQMMAHKLQELPLFAECPEALLEALATQLRSMAYMPGQVVFGQGESGDTLYVVARGKVSIHLDGRNEPLALLENGSVFGEMAVLSGEPRTATIKSASYSQLYEFEREALMQAFKQDPALQTRLEDLAAGRRPDLTNATEVLDALAAAPEALPKAEILALTRVRPARVFALSRFLEQALCLDESGEISWISRPISKFFRPTRLNVDKDMIWIADTGNERVVALSKSEGFVTRNLALELNQPRSVVPTPDGRLMIADTGNQCLLLVTLEGEVVWEYSAPHEIMGPYYAEATVRGSVLFCDRELHMVFEVDLLSDEIVWSHGEMLAAGDGPNCLNEPSCVRRMSNGGTLVADTGNDRLLLFSPVGTLMRSFTGTEDIPMIRPYHLELLDNGEILVYPETQDSVIRLGLGGQPIWQAILPK